MRWGGYGVKLLFECGAMGCSLVDSFNMFAMGWECNVWCRLVLQGVCTCDCQLNKSHSPDDAPNPSDDDDKRQQLKEAGDEVQQEQRNRSTVTSIRSTYSTQKTERRHQRTYSLYNIRLLSIRELSDCLVINVLDRQMKGQKFNRCKKFKIRLCERLRHLANSDYWNE